MNKPSENKNGYKHTPIGWLPEEWKVVMLGEVVTYKKGCAFKTESYKTTGIRIIRVSDTNMNGIKKEGTLFLDIEEAKNYTDYKLFENDIVIQTVGSRPPLYDSMVGKTIIVTKEYEGSLLNQNAVIIRDKNGNNKFLFKVLNTRRYFNYIETIMRGNANQVSITLEDLFTFHIPYPKQSEQKAIANILSIWDQAIETTQKLIAQKETRRLALMRRLLSGRKRLYGFTEKWKIKSLEEVLIPISRAVEKPDKPFLALGIRSHGKGTFLKEEFDPTKIEMDTLYTVKENDLIVNITFAWEGAIAIAGHQDDGALVSHRFPMFTFNQNEGIVDYFRYVILQPRFKYMLGLISPGGAGRNRVLSKGDFLKLELKLPDAKEQTAIAKVLRTADKELELLKQKLDALKLQKNGLMQKLLTGQLIVNM